MYFIIKHDDDKVLLSTFLSAPILRLVYFYQLLQVTDLSELSLGILLLSITVLS